MKKFLKCEIPLLTPVGKVFAPIQIVYDDTEKTANPSSEITLCYNGNEYKYYLYLTAEERRCIFNALLAFRNKLIAQGRYTDAVDEIMIKFAK